MVERQFFKLNEGVPVYFTFKNTTDHLLQLTIKNITDTPSGVKIILEDDNSVTAELDATITQMGNAFILSGSFNYDGHRYDLTEGFSNQVTQNLMIWGSCMRTSLEGNRNLRTDNGGYGGGNNGN